MEIVTSTTAPVSEWIELKGGFSVPLRAFLLVLELEEEGWTIVGVGETLKLSPEVENPNSLSNFTERNKSATKRNTLSDERREQVKIYKPYLLEVAEYIRTTS